VPFPASILPRSWAIGWAYDVTAINELKGSADSKWPAVFVRQINEPISHIRVYYRYTFSPNVASVGWSQWQRGLRCGSAAARLLGLRVPIPSGALMSVLVSFVYCQV
jgi:hypothetical protein